MTGSRYTMRRDTRKHTPPRPGPERHPGPHGPARQPPPPREFWKDEERRHAAPAPRPADEGPAAPR